MWPDRLTNPGPLTCESDALPIAQRGPATVFVTFLLSCSPRSQFFPLTLLHSEWPKLHRVLAVLSAVGLRVKPISKSDLTMRSKQEFMQVSIIFGKEARGN